MNLLDKLLNKMASAQASEEWEILAKLDAQVRRHMEVRCERLQHHASQEESKLLLSELTRAMEAYNQLIIFSESHHQQLGEQRQQIERSQRASHAYLRCAN